MLLPGESREFDLKVLIDENSSMGNIPVTVNVSSNDFPNIGAGVETITKILPDRIPDVIVPDITPRCRSGTTCDFPILLQNIGEATDVFDITVAEKNVPANWSISLAWNQSNSVQVRTDNPVNIWLTVTVPAGTEPDTTANIWLTATSTNDSRRTDSEVIDIAAAMISNAEISVDILQDEIQYVDAGESVEFGIMQAEWMYSDLS
jgi:uncharacterized membrane protein